MSGIQQRLVYALVIVNVCVHFGDLPTWIPTIGVLFVCWRWAADLVRIPCPGRLGAAIFAAFCGAGIWAEFGRIIGDPASTALLVTMIALKALEIRGYRDLMIVTYMCLLLLMSKLLASQSIAMMIFMFMDLVAVLALMHLYHIPNVERGLPWKRALRLVGQAAPVLLVLFVLFPRFNFSLIRRGPDTSGAVGFSGQLRPGAVAQLAQSDKVAFRAFFKGHFVPPMSRLYWRGAVLSQNKGLEWDPAVNSFAAVRPGAENTYPAGGGTPVEIIVEDGGASWVFTMDWPAGVQMNSLLRQSDIHESEGLTYALRTPLQPWETYRFYFEPSSQKLSWPLTEVSGSLSVAAPSARVAEQIKEWRKLAKSDAAPEILDVLRMHFSGQGFSYTLTPPETEDLDEFLFTTKRGYCEHYAGATATILRLMGIPARVIVGYQGGSPSLIGDYLIVSQRDAHAWVEYWHKDRLAWIRVDPTSWVAEERLNLGGQAYIEKQGAAGYGGFEAAWLKKVFGDQFLVWLSRSRLLADQAEIAWITFMLRYDFTYQRELFAKFGWRRISAFSLFMLALSGVIVSLLAVAWVMWRRRRPPGDRALRLYQELCQRLAQSGLERQYTEGPLDLAFRAAARWPEHAERLQAVFNQLINVRYGTAPFGEREWALIRRDISRLKFDKP
jgi:protein-glutamine gamma-glutamyltransferase